MTLLNNTYLFQNLISAMAPETEFFCHLCQKTFDKKEAISAHICVEIKQETQDSKVQDHEDLNINSTNFQPLNLFEHHL